MSVPSSFRNHERHEMFECAMLFRPDNATPIRSIIVDVGLGGAQLRSKNALPVGCSCILKVGHDNGTPLTFRGEIRHSTRVEGSDLFASGFKFLPVSHEEKLLVASFLHSVAKGDSSALQ